MIQKVTIALLLGAAALCTHAAASVRGAQRNHPHRRRSLQSNDVILELNAGVDDGAYVHGYVGTSTNGVAIDVSDVDEDYAELRFQSHRYGTSGFYYTIPDLESTQDYDIILGFAENWHGACSPTQRIFSVTCNGEALVSSLDVVAESGACYKALVESTTCTSSTEGALVIEFTSTVQNPMVSFVDILKSSGPAPTPTISANPVVLVNAGVDDAAYFSNGGVWDYKSDEGVSGSNLYPASWFESHRSGYSGFSYTIPGLVPGQQYEISIGFAENYAPNCSPGKRVMNIEVNGETFAQSLDVFVAAGDCFKALVLSGTHDADQDGKLMVTFHSSVENPMLSVLEIKSFDTVAPPTPVVAPVISPTPPTPTTRCQVPQFDGDWLDGTQYPLNVAESQGAIIQNDFLVVSGFAEGYGQSTAKCYAIDTGDPDAAWRAMDDLPMSEGVTHGAYVVLGSKFYLCGGFLGGHPGPHIPDCLVYDHAMAPGDGQQWTHFTPLPDGRAGGALVYDKGTHSLIYTAGAERPNYDEYMDYEDTWALNLSNIHGDWVRKADIPYLTNHMSSATGMDETGTERHFFLGGQMGEDEHSGNLADNFEYVSATNTWIRRQSMPFTRGHASSSTVAIGCGLIVAAGSTNEYGQTADVSYYDIPSDSWTSIGELPNAINTPVCDISVDNYLFCESGWAMGKFSYKRKIVMV